MKLSHHISDLFSGKSVNQVLRFGVIGVATNSIGYFAYLAITYMGGSPKITMSILYTLGVIVGFLGNRTWAFTDNRGLTNSAKHYLVTYMLGYFINLITLFVFVDIYDFKHYFVYLAASIVMPIYFFIMLKLYVFND